MWLMLQHEKPDDYIVATGETHSVRDFVESAFQVVNLPWEKVVKHDTVFDRLADPATLVGSAKKIEQAFGWKPSGDFQQLVREMVEAELAAIEETSQ